MNTAANAEDRCRNCGGSLSKVWIDGELVGEYCPICTPEAENERVRAETAHVNYTYRPGTKKPCPKCGGDLFLFRDGIFTHLFSRRGGHDGRPSCDYEEPSPKYERVVETLAAEIHNVYQREAERQKDVRHPDDYDELPENLKDYDRALAKWVVRRFRPDLLVRRDSSLPKERDRDRRRESDESRPRGRFSELIIPPEEER